MGANTHRAEAHDGGETPSDRLAAPTREAEALSRRFEPLGARGRLELTLGGAAPGPVALVSSFGADSAVLLHLVSEIHPATPVLFLDTEMLFPETLTYQERLAEMLKLQDVRRIRPEPAALVAADPQGDLHRRDADACCALRKTAPLERALSGFGTSISGRKRHQAASRTAMALVEADGPRLKVNPLADWTARQVAEHRLKAGLPAHPLAAQGYPSIGCAPCTTPVGAGEDARAGRWRGSDKTECGIHFVNGRLVRGA